MISTDMWQPHEPRMNFPIFGDAVNEVDFTVQDDRRLTSRRIASPFYRWIFRGLPFATMLSDYQHMFAPRPLTFRGCFVDCKGELLCHGEFPGAHHPGDYFHCNINDWLASHNVPLQDGNFILVSNRGRADRWQSSPGNITLRIRSGSRVAGYRTGFFARPLNAGHKHVGFTGLNPRVEANEHWVSGLLLINHSSEPGYDNRVKPTVRLYRSDKEYLEADFGEIAPHASAERSILELFPDAEKFLSQSGGIGYTITTLKGTSLASVHVLRSRRGELAALEHSRPAHTNIINYM